MIRRLILSFLTTAFLTVAYFTASAYRSGISPPPLRIWAAASAPEVPSRYYKVPVMIFHNIDGRGGYSIRSEEFREILEEIRSQNIRILSMQELIFMARSGTYPDTPSAVITFDDDYENIARIAAPLLREYRIPASFYAYIANISENEERGFAWEDLNRLLAEGFEVQNHSWSHGVFHRPNAGESPQQYAARIDREIRQSKELLEKRLMRKIHSFALPMGYKSPALIEKIRNEGYELILLADGDLTDLRGGFNGILDRPTVKSRAGLSPLDQFRLLMKKTGSE